MSRGSMVDVMEYLMESIASLDGRTVDGVELLNETCVASREG